MKRIGIDVGGTFTDVVLIDDADGKVWSTKVPTTPRNRVIGAIEGFTRIIEMSGCAPHEIAFVGHGTTMATNMVVEGKGAPTALITTKGFRDILELRRVSRHDRADLYDLSFSNPVPLVERRWRLEVNERMRFDGSVETALDLAELPLLAARIEASSIEAVAIVFLHAHVNPEHERLVSEELRRLLPDHFICTSHEINPEAQEYERASSTVINAMLGPICGRYIRELGRALKEKGFAGSLMFMQSNGGLAMSSIVAARPVVLLESGPAGGVSAALRNCEASGTQNAILGDMGGTTFDVSLIRDYHPELRGKSLLHSYVVRSPTIDIDSIGAGGGSIAWIDGGGGLRIGPQSAGADPGPACYGRGGRQPTVTDCNLVLGYIDGDRFLGGEFKLDQTAANQAIERYIAAPLGIGVREAARAVREIANALMAQAIRIMTVERGFDPREFTYICYGGAGPVHALDLARSIGIKRVVIPPLPGLFSAFGMTVADQQYDYQTPVERAISELGDTDILAKFDELEAVGGADLWRVGIKWTEVVTIRRADCRYVGQPEAITLTLTPDCADLRSSIANGFAEAHQRHWNFVSPDKEIVLSNLRVQLVTTTGWRGAVPQDAVGDPAPVAKRRVWLADGETVVPVFARASMPVGALVQGPSVIEEHSTCLVLEASQTATVDSNMNLVIELAA